MCVKKPNTNCIFKTFIFCYDTVRLMYRTVLFFKFGKRFGMYTNYFI